MGDGRPAGSGARPPAHRTARGAVYGATGILAILVFAGYAAAEDAVGRGVLGTRAYPETFVLDRRRRIRARFDGKRPWNSRQMLDYLSRFL